jgi:hypothetical protein
MHMRSELVGYGALGLAIAAAFVACAADPGDATKSVSQQATTGTSGSTVIDAGGSGMTGTTGSAAGAAGASGTYGSGVSTGSAAGASGAATGSTTGSATGASGATTGAAGATTGSTGTITGSSTGTIAGSTGTTTGSTGTITGSTGTITGSTGSTGTVTGSAGTTGSTDDAGMDAGFTGTGCAPGAMVVPMTPSSQCGSSPTITNTQGALGAICFTLKPTKMMNWAASNAGPVSGAPGCSVTVTGGGTTQMVSGATASMTAQPPMTAGADGSVYWNLTAGCINYVSVYCY